MKQTILLTTLLYLSIPVHADIPSDIGIEFITNAVSNVGVRHANDGTGRKFYIDQTGRIMILDDQDDLITTPFLNISNLVNASSTERGLLGLAFHPNYNQNGYFFVNYTKSSPNSGDTIIARYQASKSDPNIADPNSGTVLMRVAQDFSNHNGGNILFGPDGYLYIGMGDGGSGGDPNDRAQDLTSALGKMLRIDVDNDNPPNNPAPSGNGAACPQDSDNYSIPPSNPSFTTTGACPEIWSYGLRNPWRWSFDKQTGDMYIGDVGQNAIEEVSFQPANSTGGEHYGWNCKEGTSDFENGSNCLKPLPAMVDPFIEFTRTSGRCAVTGGYVYRGPITSLQSKYLYADYCTGRIWINDLDGSPSTEWEGHTANGLISSFGEDEQGNLYISASQSYGSSSTFIYKITGDVAPNDIIFANGFESLLP